MLLLFMAPLSWADKPAIVLFDQGHGQLFSPFKSDGLSYSLFASLFTKAGFECRTSQATITPRSLQNVSAYIVSGAFRTFDAAEIKVLNDYVQKGGKVVILLHTSEPVARLTESFGIVVSNVPVRETDPGLLIDQSALNFLVQPNPDHGLTKGIGKLAFYGVFALLAEGKECTLLASTTRTSYADLDANGRWNSGDPTQSFGVVALSSHHAGGVLVIGDDALFSNPLITEADNLAFAQRIVEWLRPRARSEGIR